MAQPTSPRTDAPRVDPAALSVEDLARLLCGGGRRVSAAQVRADLDAGAPANADGTVNLVHFTAWLLREVTRDGR